MPQLQMLIKVDCQLPTSSRTLHQFQDCLEYAFERIRNPFDHQFLSIALGKGWQTYEGKQRKNVWWRKLYRCVCCEPSSLLERHIKQANQSEINMLRSHKAMQLERKRRHVIARFGHKNLPVAPASFDIDSTSPDQDRSPTRSVEDKSVCDDGILIETNRQNDNPGQAGAVDRL